MRMKRKEYEMKIEDIGRNEFEDLQFEKKGIKG